MLHRASPAPIGWSGAAVELSAQSHFMIGLPFPGELLIGAWNGSPGSGYARWAG
jgi:hypothetical protein